LSTVTKYNLFIAVDIGNTRIKFGAFSNVSGDKLPEPEKTLALSAEAPQFDELPAWLAVLESSELSWHIGSVNRPAATRLLDWLRDRRPRESVTLLTSADLPLSVRLKRLDMVGIDRLLNAMSANALRKPNRPAVVVDLGTAITVDLVAINGAFLGGAILPGIGMSARAMREFTDLLPLVDMTELGSPPPVIGTSTISAIQSGLFWGAVGGIRELVRQFTYQLDADPQVFFTGGAGQSIASALGENMQYIPHLSLAGIAIAVKSI
jgi:type III pantothenate kinase